MNTKYFAKLAITAFVISVAAATQASEITEFPLSTVSKLSRAEVQADAMNVAQPKGEIGFSYDAATVEREARGNQTRMQAQTDKTGGKLEKMAGAYFIGGM